LHGTFPLREEMKRDFPDESHPTRRTASSR
jgi:hypothetical protein